MKTYDVECPVCGRINRNLYLEETDGWMECECCRSTVRQNTESKSIIFPVMGAYRRKETVAAT